MFAFCSPRRKKSCREGAGAVNSSHLYWIRGRIRLPFYGHLLVVSE